MKVFVKFLNNSLVTVETSPHETILSIKKAIEKKKNIPSANQKLIFGRRLLHDYQTLEYYNIRQYNTLYHVLRPLSPKAEEKNQEQPAKVDKETPPRDGF